MDLIERQVAIDAVEFGITYAKAINKSTGEVKELFKEGNKALNEAVERLKELPSAQPEPCEDTISRQAVIEINRSYHGQMPNEVNHRIWKEINELPSAQPETHDKRTKTHACDCISRQAAIDAVYKCDDIFVGDMPVMVVKADAYEALAQLPSAQPDLSGYSDKLWKAAYERGKAEAQAEIVRCKDCKHRTSYWGNCRLLEEKYHQSVLVDGDSFCSMAERRTDDCV